MGAITNPNGCFFTPTPTPTLPTPSPEEVSCSGGARTQGGDEPPQDAPSPPGNAPTEKI